MDGIDNILLFVSDSLRYDYLPARMRECGVCFKTIAQSTHSPPSFATLSTGRYPPEHGVHGFGDSIADGIDTLYHATSHDGLYYHEGRFLNDPFYKLYNISDPRHLSDLNEPYYYLERDTSTHSPYIVNGILDGVTADSYFADRGTDIEALQSDYRDVIDWSINLLNRRISLLERLSQLKNTLVIFTADHGESFGEHGTGTHGAPIVPETVYVPTVFIHPSLSETDFQADPDSDVIEHVDVVETALSAAGFDEHQTSGIDLLNSSRPRDWGYSHVKIEANNRTVYEADSLWGSDGGQIVHSNGLSGRFVTYLHHLFRSVDRRTVRANAREALGTYLNSTRTHGSPPMSVESAKDELKDFRASLSESEGGDMRLDETMEQQLEDLGYVT